jgi:hypothetical protein
MTTRGEGDREVAFVVCGGERNRNRRVDAQLEKDLERIEAPLERESLSVVLMELAQEMMRWL